MIKWFFLLLFLIFVYHVREVFPPFIVGGIIAYLLNPLVRWLCRRVPWISPGIAVAIIYLGTLFTVLTLFVAFGPKLATEFKDIYIQRHDMVRSVVGQIETTLHLGFDPDKVTDDILVNAEHAGKPSEIMHFGGLISKSLLAILVCTVSSIYFITDSTRVGKFFIRFVPEERRVMVVNLSSQTNIMLSKYVSGQLILVALMSVVTWGILTCFGIKFALFIGIFCGVLEIIPVLGPLLGIGLATIVGCTQLHFDVISLGIPAALFLARQIEDYVVVPKVIGHAVELHPLAVIFAVLVGEHMAGALGMLIAIPVAASIKLIIDFCYPPDPYDKEPHKEHGGLLAYIVHKFKGDPKNRTPECPPDPHPQKTDTEADEDHAKADWAEHKGEVTNATLAAQNLMLADLEEQELKEVAKEKLEARKKEAAAAAKTEETKAKDSN